MIGVWIRRDGDYFDGVITGIAAYCREQSHLALRYDRKIDPLSPPAPQIKGLSGVIVMATDPDWLRFVRRLPVPSVNVSEKIDPVGIPSVLPDNLETGRKAASFFVARGYRSLAYCGWDRIHFSEVRARGFLERSSESGLEPRLFQLPGRPGDAATYEQAWKQVIHHLQRLPKPLAVFCANDDMASKLVARLHHSGLSVPEEIAVAGVDNSPWVSMFSPVTLSSIDLPIHRIGYEAARLVDSMIKGVPPPERPIRLPPLDFIVRQSSDAVGVPDPLVARALRFLHARYREPVTGSMVAEGCGASRALVYLHFRKVLGRTLQEELRRIRLSHARRLLLSSSLTLDRIAEESGFGDVRTLITSFRSAYNTTPGNYRKQMRA